LVGTRTIKAGVGDALDLLAIPVAAVLGRAFRAQVCKSSGNGCGEDRAGVKKVLHVDECVGIMLVRRTVSIDVW